MGDLIQHRVVTGLFLCAVRGNRKSFCTDYFFWSCIYLNFVFYNFVLSKIIACCNDIETNPGPNIGQQLISICHMNARSIIAKGNQIGVSKFDEIRSFVLFHNFSIFAVTETWLDVQISDDTLLIPGYSTIYRRDRNRHGGGVCVYISDQFSATRVVNIEPADAEVMCVEFKLYGIKSIVCICYKPPNHDTIDFLTSIQTVLDKSNDYGAIMFIGDFNCKHSHFYEHDRDTADGGLLNNFCEALNFKQFINEPTHFSSNNKSCLDLFFTNNASSVRDTNVHSVINNCDHAPRFSNFEHEIHGGTIILPSCLELQTC